MRLARPARRPAGETIIALIDVVFFLLVFAMLAGRMDATAPFEMAPPLALTGDDLASGGITLAVGPDGRIALDGDETDASGAIAGIAEALAAGGADTLLRINAHRDAALRDVLPLLGQLEAAGATNVVFVVTPGEG